MRKALNENPKVQAGVVAVLLVLGLIMFMRMSSGGAEAPPPAQPTAAAAGATGVPTDPATGASGAGVPATTATASATATAAAAAGGIPAAPVSSTGTVSPGALVPGRGLPADVAQAFARGDAVVILFVKENATDDELVKRSVQGISRSGVSVFVAQASEVARYARIASGVGLNRVPALVVVRPRSVGGDVPQAMVSYGFRNSQSVIQQVEDALYRGRDDMPYHPG